MEIKVNGVNLEKVHSFRHHGVDKTAVLGPGTEFIHRNRKRGVKDIEVYVE